MTVEARRVRIEYDFTVTSKSVTMIDKTTRTQRMLSEQVNRTQRDINNLNREMRQTAPAASKGASALRSFANASHNVSRSIGNLTRSLFSWRTLFMGYFAGNMLGNAKKALIDYNAELDNFRQGIALSLNQMTDWDRSFGGISDRQERWNKSMMGANSVMSILRKTAASSIGSTREYMEGFQMLNSAIQAVGGTAGDTVEVVKRLIPLAKASGRDVMTGVMDITQILRGDTNLRQVNLPVFRDPRVLELAKTAKGIPKQGVQGDPYAAMKGLIDVMSKADPALKSYSQTFNAQLETATDNLQMFAAEIGKPIFNKITDELKIFNKDWGSTQMKLQATGEKIGKFLVATFDKAKANIDNVVESLKKMGAQLAVVATGLVGMRVAGAAAGLLSFAGTGAARNKIDTTKAKNAWRRVKDPFNFADMGNIDMSGLNANGAMGKMGSGVQSGSPSRPQLSSAANGTGAVGMLRSGAGVASMALLGLGVAMTSVTEQAEKLSKQHGYVGEMAKKAKEAMHGIQVVLDSIATAAVMAVGSLAKMGEAIGTLAAKAVSAASGLSAPRAYSSFNKSDKLKTADDVQKLTETYESQMKYEKEQKARLLGLSSDPMFQSLVEASFSEANKTDDRIGKMIGGKGGIQAAFRRASAYKDGPMIEVGGKKYMEYNDHGGIPLDPDIIASYDAEGNESAMNKVDFAKRKVLLELRRRKRKVDKAVEQLDRYFTDEFLGQKAKTEVKVDMSGSTFNVKQDFRDQDPDRVAIQFFNDLGKIAATGLQSRLAPMLD